ncbi:hypothetical protein J2755_000840 [Methanohalophilus levihalophilus]|uniref:DUF2254 family protein n=1 Tax=Methanohalophilus levihalophilus TaxID=1431282 RepID=UPI001AE931D7|nr:DUF2254 family protein [Methanohalophilus levihalophilus]MBP2029906.1 hypothetical protein [Methanohalophilus levihalophilus]
MPPDLVALLLFFQPSFNTFISFTTAFSNEMFENLQEQLGWLNEPKWANRVTFYVFFFACIGLAFRLATLLIPAISDYSFLQSGVNEDNVRYMLSALVQSLAAVIAIVVTLSLVAIQLSAQSYSSRVIDFYKTMPDLWILIFVYVIAIVFGLGLINSVGTDVLPADGILSFKYLLTLEYLFGVGAFLCLFPYSWNTMSLMNPTKIIRLLSESITKEKMDFATTSTNDQTQDLKILNKNGEEDPFLPIIDILTASMMKYDYATLRTGSNALSIKTSEILSKEHEKEVSEHVANHLKRVSMLSLKRGDEESFEIFMGCFAKIANNTVKNGLERATKSIVSVLEEIGVQALSNQNYLVVSSIYTLKKIGIMAGEKGQKSATSNVISALNTFCQYPSFKGVDSSLISALDRVSQDVIEKKWCQEVEQIIYSLGFIEDRVLQTESYWDIDNIIHAYARIGEKAAQNDCPNSVYLTLIPLGNIGREMVRHETRLELEFVLDAIQKIGENAVHLGDNTDIAIKQLEIIEDEGIKREWGKIARKRIARIKQKQSEEINSSPLEHDSD